MGARCFWLEPTNTVRYDLRRYAPGACASGHGYHNAQARWKDARAIWTHTVRGMAGKRERCPLLHNAPRKPPQTFRLWPKSCAHCGYRFKKTDHWQVFVELYYRRTDTGARLTLREAPVGALWNGWWLPSCYRGKDGLALFCKTPGGDWLIDGEASNCTDPARNHGGKRTHYCWMRHGNPSKGETVTVDIVGRQFCTAGAGSIQIGSYHGFLTNGALIP